MGRIIPCITKRYKSDLQRILPNHRAYITSVGHLGNSIAEFQIIVLTVISKKKLKIGRFFSIFENFDLNHFVNFFKSFENFCIKFVLMKVSKEIITGVRG